MASKVKCPICDNASVKHAFPAEAFFSCDHCGHYFRVPEKNIDYRLQLGRNKNNPWHVSKIENRSLWIEPFLKPHAKILEIGCAEGDLGAKLLEMEPTLQVDGLEPSQDAKIAGQRLGTVFPISIEEAVSSPERVCDYDLILAFHVFEHLASPRLGLVQIRKMLAKEGRILIEVPSGLGGSNHIPIDRNPEHLQFFSSSSLCLLFERAGMEVIFLQSGYVESLVYDRCTRLIAQQATPASRKVEVFTDYFTEYLGPKFSIYGIGGMFWQCVEPYIDPQHLEFLFDADKSKQGTNVLGKPVLAPERLRVDELRGPILVTSIDYEKEIIELLSQKQGLRSSQIIPLSTLLEAQLHEP